MKLTKVKRDALPASAFGLPAERKYPMPDESHARNALARASANATPKEKAKIKRKVIKRFPGIKMGE